MALRDQPYIPLYVQDFLTDEKLADCSAASTGVYIRLMCLMHKSEYYGRILLKQKYKQTTKQVKNFASQLAKQMPYDYHTVESALEELLEAKVLIEERVSLTEDGQNHKEPVIAKDLSEEYVFLTQKRMVKDGEISEKRAKAGKKGGDTSMNLLKQKNKFASNFAQAKSQANSENENENENMEGGVGETKNFEHPESVFENSFEIAKRLKKTTYIGEVGMITGHSSETVIIKEMDVFCNELKARAELLKTEKDFRKHFLNWLKIKVKNKEIEYEKPKEVTVFK